MTPERKARVEMDALLAAAGTHVCDMAQANGHPAMDVTIRALPLDGGVGFVENLLRINGRACGVVEAMKQGATLAGVELRCGRYAQAVADSVNVNYEVYLIKIEVSEQGAKVTKGFWMETQDKTTRFKTARRLDNDFEYQSEALAAPFNPRPGSH